MSADLFSKGSEDVPERKGIFGTVISDIYGVLRTFETEDEDQEDEMDTSDSLPPGTKQEVEEKDQQAMVMKGECIILENGKKRAEDRISVLQVSMMGRSGDTE